MLVVGVTIAIVSSCATMKPAVNSGNSAIFGPDGDTDGEVDPDGFYLDGAGVQFLECVVIGDNNGRSKWLELESTSYLTEYTFIVRNIGSIALGEMDVTWQADYADGTRTFGEAFGYWSEFLPGEIKTFSITDDDGGKTPVSLTILTARLDPVQYDLESIALTADPLVVFLF